MSQLMNHTSLAVAMTAGYDEAARRYVLAVAKATYEWNTQGQLTLVGDQDAVCEQDVLGATDVEDGANPFVEMESDLIPVKPKLDVLVCGNAELSAPAKIARARLVVGRRLDKSVTLIGDRRWYENILNLVRLDDPRAFTTMPLLYSHAFGGRDAQDTSRCEQRNPVGRGFCKIKNNVALVGRRAPNIEHLKDPTEPVGFGPVGRHWLPRRRLAGTYDAAWERDRYPFLPTDFDVSFFNCAPADQQLAGGYIPGEVVQLFGLTPQGNERFALPKMALTIGFVTSSGVRVNKAAAPDTVIIVPNRRRISLVMRATFEPKPDITALREVHVHVEEGGK